jgi:hypothetical protein
MNLPIYIQTHIDKPFEWGSNDCITFSIGFLEIQTGRDYLTEHRPWRSAREARKKLIALSGLFFLLEQNLTRINPTMAQDGDLTIYQGAAHLFSGRHIVSVGHDGLVFADRAVAKEAWTYRCRQQ